MYKFFGVGLLTNAPGHSDLTLARDTLKPNKTTQNLVVALASVVSKPAGTEEQDL